MARDGAAGAAWQQSCKWRVLLCCPDAALCCAVLQMLAADAGIGREAVVCCVCLSCVRALWGCAAVQVESAAAGEALPSAEEVRVRQSCQHCSDLLCMGYITWLTPRNVAAVQGPHASLAVRLSQRDPGRSFVLVSDGPANAVVGVVATVSTVATL